MCFLLKDIPEYIKENGITVVHELQQKKCPRGLLCISNAIVVCMDTCASPERKTRHKQGAAELPE
jgi:hypothetical protein